MVSVASEKYKKDLENEINEFREMNGRDAYPSDDDDNGDSSITIDEVTGEVISKESNDLKMQTISTTDPESGMYVKGRRVFTEGKEYHGLRYTRYRGLKKF